MNTFYYVIFKDNGESYKATFMHDGDIIEAAQNETAFSVSLEERAGIELIEDADGEYHYARELTSAERFRLSVEKLNDDGRIFQIFPADDAGAVAEFIRAADQHGLGERAAELINKDKTMPVY